jgi:GTP-binding protein LepA
VTIPQARLRNFSIIAHIDHGKSTLADRLLEFTHTIEPRQMTSQVLDSMDLEREKGITIKARAVRLEHTAQDGLVYGLNLIDTPGHVDFSYEVSRSLQACEGAILVVDAAQGIEAQTLANVHLALRQNLVIIPVINKIDLPSAQPDVVIEELENVLAIPREEVLLASAKEGTGILEILEAIIHRVPPPKGRPTDPLRCLVFDSHYDQYKGVVTYVRLAAGTLHEHERIRLMGSGAEADILELGVFRPQMVPVKVLTAGEVGYIATGLKGTRSRTPGPPPSSRSPATRLPRAWSSPGSTRSPARTTRSCATRWRSSTSTTRASPSSPNRRSPSGSGSAAASWGSSTWRSSRNASSGNSASSSSPRRRPSNTG